jgi:hypothetical protein
MRGAGRVDPQQDVDLLDVLLRDLPDRGLGHRDLVLCGVG